MLIISRGDDITSVCTCGENTLGTGGGATRVAQGAIWVKPPAGGTVQALDTSVIRLSR
jgi:hypothetical protein